MNRNFPLTDQKYGPNAEMVGFGGKGAWENEHIVQFYEADEHLIGSLVDYVHSGLASGDACIIVATKDHLDSMEERLMTQGLDLEGFRVAGQYLSLDAVALLSKLIVNGVLQSAIVDQLVAELIVRSIEAHGRVRIFGEMVNLLWEEGQYDCALDLEKDWSRIQKSYPFLLLCGYSIKSFHEEGMTNRFMDVCDCHTKILSAGRHPSSNGPSLHLERRTSVSASKAFKQGTEKWEAGEPLGLSVEVLHTISQEISAHVYTSREALKRIRRSRRLHSMIEGEMQDIEYHIGRLSKIAFNLSDLAKIWEDKFSLRQEKIDLNQLLSEAIEVFRPILDARRQRLAISLLSAVQIEVDAARFLQAILNILENAAIVTPPEEMIRLLVEIKNRVLLIRVKDHGPEATRRIPLMVFEPISQAYQSLNDSVPDLNIGFILAVKIIELHGGTVELFRFGSGNGNEVIVFLPLPSEYEFG